MIPSIGTIFDNAPWAMSVSDFQTGIWIGCNQALRDMLGLPEFGWEGKTSIETDLWDDPLVCKKLARLLNDDEKITNFHVKLKHRQGHRVETVISAIKFVSDNSTYALATYLDASQFIARVQSAEIEEARLSRGLRGSASTVWEWEVHSGIAKLLQQWVGQLGYAPGELLLSENTLGDVIEPHNAASLVTQLETHIRTGSHFKLEVSLRTKQGAYRWFSIRGLANLDSVSRAVRISGTLDDFTDRHFIETERKRVNDRLTLAITATEMGTWEVFPDGSAIWDAQSYRLYGLDPSTSRLPQDIYRESLNNTQLERASKWLTDALHKKTFSSIEFSIIWPDGQVRWLAAKGKAIQGATAQHISLLGVHWDITEQKRATLALEKYQLELTELNHRLMQQENEIHKALAYSLHDQLGQTLTAMRLRVDTLTMLTADNPDLFQHCSMLETLTSNAVDEVRDVLKRLHPPLLDELGLGRALESEMNTSLPVHMAMKMAYFEDECASNTRWDSDVEYVSFMIAREAISNAIQHSGARHIEVELRAVTKGFVLRIQDDGRGIAPPIFQSRPGHLGLVSMRERAHAIGASLSIISQAHMGTTVTLEWTAET